MQKIEIDQHILHDRGYQKVLYVDSEFSVDPKWFTLNGVDMDDLVFVAPENQSAEQILEIVFEFDINRWYWFSYY